MNVLLSRSRFTLATLAVVAGALAGCSGMPMMGGMGMGSSVTLTGAQEVPPVPTAAAGTMKYTVGSDMSISGTVETTGITSVAAHIHDGAMGVNGPVIIPLTRTSSNGWAVPPGAKFTDAQYHKYMSGELYVNVHSAAYKDGEIRAQLKP